jgi:translation initiation factor RLI1
LLRGDKIGLLGPNGAGKTTLLKLILGELQPDVTDPPGKIRQGANLQVAYFDQMRDALDLDATLEDFISPGSEWVEINGQKKHVKSYLTDFLFSPARANSPVRTLSGGERNRLLLARLFARPANVLVLDEPTNDLDIDTLELLEELLQSYDGTVLLVSHDRRFLDNVVTSTIAYEGTPENPGFWREYEGGVTDWILKQVGVPVHLDRVYETDMAEGLKVMALEGHGIAFLPRSAVKKEIQAGTLVEVGLPDGQTLALSMEVRAYREKTGAKPCFKSSAHQLWLHLTQSTSSVHSSR